MTKAEESHGLEAHSRIGAPSPYRELIRVLEVLPVLVLETRRRKGLSVRAAAKQVGMSFATLSRFEARKGDLQMDNVMALLRWVGDVPETGGDRDGA